MTCWSRNYKQNPTMQNTERPFIRCPLIDTDRKCRRPRKGGVSESCFRLTPGHSLVRAGALGALDERTPALVPSRFKSNRLPFGITASVGVKALFAKNSLDEIESRGIGRRGGGAGPHRRRCHDYSSCDIKSTLNTLADLRSLTRHAESSSQKPPASDVRHTCVLSIELADNLEQAPVPPLEPTIFWYPLLSICVNHPVSSSKQYFRQTHCL